MSCMIPGKPRESRCLASAPSRRIHRPRVSLNPILADQQSSRSKADVLPLFFISAATQVGFCWVADGKAKACPVGPRRDHVQARARSQRKVALPLIGMLIFERCDYPDQDPGRIGMQRRAAIYPQSMDKKGWYARKLPRQHNMSPLVYGEFSFSGPGIESAAHCRNESHMSRPAR